ncbi:MAG: hypothetical protein GXY76_10375 [Chloroflexi bacterium]|nr:hypothetical protein [Chloroflexota bacterium]
MLTPEQHRELLAALGPLDAQYDPLERMLREPFHSPGYHTTLKGGFTHPTRSALSYAVALLDAGEPWRRERACHILDRVIALQDQDPQSRTYGLWSWFMEEPLEKMSPPDWNWADFNGAQLLQVALDHHDRLPADLAQRLDESILHACRSIQRRDVGPGYTNIAIMGTYVTYVAAERYDVPDLLAYAQMRLQRFYDYTLEQDGFVEFNSPTYTVVALRLLSLMRMHIKDPWAQQMLAELHEIGWRDVARRFHPPTNQWAGPHSRCYATLLQPGTLAFIQRACHGAVDFFPQGEPPPSIESARLALACPERYRPAFATLDGPRDEVQVFLRGRALARVLDAGHDKPVIGTTHLEEAFALGSANRMGFWNQHRPLVAYWGARQHPQALQARFLHDFYDYCSAQVFCVQSGGCVLAGVNFATDYGDTHVNLDKVRDATIRARDLRLRFEFQNMPASWQSGPWQLGQVAHLDLGGAQMDLLVPYAALGDWPARAEAGREGNNAFLDVVLYQGEERAINFAEIREGGIILGVSLRAQGTSDPKMEIRCEVVGDHLRATWPLPEAALSLEMYVKPGPVAWLHSLAPA